MGAKAKSEAFECDSCCQRFAKWTGQCSHCGVWNSIKGRSPELKKSATEVQALGKILVESDDVRYSTGLPYLDRVVGG